MFFNFWTIEKDYQGGNVEYYQCDISDTKAVEEMWNKIITKHHKVDLLINNAARTLGKRIKDLSFD